MTEDKAGKMKSEIGVAKSATPTITVDCERYGQYLDNSDLTDAEKQQFLDALWSIIVSFVDLGFGVHPAQLAAGDSCENSCEQSAEIRSFITTECAPVINSADTDKIQDDAAGGQASIQEGITK